ncbi:hypothetical protein [Streptomyces sp. KL116D]|uniref:hypothetical protein n=1 Tax=Streptomyces sp. KL116D TaxID=3045152 RepID=UPI0035587C9B
MAKDPIKDYCDQLDAALAPHMDRAADRLMEMRLIDAAKHGGTEAAKAVAREMTPEQAARVAKRLAT